MANRIKRRVKTSYAKGFASKAYTDRGARRGEQGKSRHPGYSGGARVKAIGDAQAKRAYNKRIKASNP